MAGYKISELPFQTRTRVLDNNACCRQLDCVYGDSLTQYLQVFIESQEGMPPINSDMIIYPKFVVSR